MQTISVWHYYYSWHNENNKSFNLFTQSSYIDKYTVDKEYQHWNYQNNNLTLSFNNNNFPGKVSNNQSLSTKPWAYITKYGYEQNDGATRFTSGEPGKITIFNFNKFMYLTSFDMTLYAYNIDDLDYYDETSKSWVEIYRWNRKLDGSNVVLLTNNNKNTNYTSTSNFNSNNNNIQTPKVDLENNQNNFEYTDNVSYVTKQEKPARTYRLRNEYKGRPGYTNESNGGYFMRLKAKIINDTV